MNIFCAMVDEQQNIMPYDMSSVCYLMSLYEFPRWVLHPTLRLGI